MNSPPPARTGRAGEDKEMMMDHSETVFCSKLVRNPSGGVRPEGWERRVAEHILQQASRLAELQAENARLRDAIDYILDGMGISYPDYEIDAQDDYADAANSKWVKDTLARLAALLRAKP